MRQDPAILFLGEIRDNFSSKASMDFADKEVMRSLRAAHELREIPVAFFTGTDDENETRELMALGAWQIFQKPFSPKTFADRVLSQFQER